MKSNKRLLVLSLLLIAAGLTYFITSGAAATTAKIVFSGGTTMTVKSGGTVTLASGSTLNESGTATLKTGGTLTADSGSTVTLSGTTNAARGVATGYYIARGSVAYAGTTAIVTGLTDIVSATANMNDASTATMLVTVTKSSGTLTLKTWQQATPTSALSQASATRTVYWIAVGTK